MKNKLAKITIISIICALSLQLLSFAASDAKITAAYGTPVIDGVIDEVWQNAEQQSVALVDKEVISSDTKTTGTFRTMWDENYFYVLVEVDKHGVGISADYGNNENTDDCADVCLTLDGNFEAIMTAGGDDYAGVFRVIEDGSKSGFGWIFENLEDEAMGSFKRTSDSAYLTEYAIPWSDIVPAEGNVVSLDIQINDATDGSRTGLVTWASTPCYCWRESYEHGTVTLGAKPAEKPAETPTETPEETPTETPADTTAPETSAETTAPQTSDAGIIIALLVTAAAAGAILLGTDKRTK